MQTPPLFDAPSLPPTSWRKTFVHLGPGIILASSIVGSGELIATTTVGAEAGFVLLWLILVGCAIKVAAQIEIGRMTLTWGKTPLAAFEEVPGPRLGGLGWIYWCWVLMTCLVVVQQGGILAGVAQSLSGGLPLTSSGSQWNRDHDHSARLKFDRAVALRQGKTQDADALKQEHETLLARMANVKRPPDETIWMVIVGVITAALLAVGRYRLIETVSILLVGTFTLVTLVALWVLQFDPFWRISAAELASGLTGGLPKSHPGSSPMMTALATLGIIGVGASELIVYPYWCLEKGYGRSVGPRDDSPEWAQRARGWMRVMQLDAWGSMCVYTIVTVAFYLLGATTLGRLGLRPVGSEMVRTLSQMYVPVFGAWAEEVFLVGAFAVLYSTLFVAAAGNARLVVDGLILSRWLPGDDLSRAWWNRTLSVLWPLVAMVFAIAIREPVGMVLASGAAQAIMLAAIAVAVIFFRYRKIDSRLKPGPAWDLLLWVSSCGFLVIGLWTAWEKFAQFLR